MSSLIRVTWMVGGTRMIQQLSSAPTYHNRRRWRRGKFLGAGPGSYFTPQLRSVGRMDREGIPDIWTK